MYVSNRDKLKLFKSSEEQSFWGNNFPGADSSVLIFPNFETTMKLIRLINRTKLTI